MNSRLPSLRIGVWGLLALVLLSTPAMASGGTWRTKYQADGDDVYSRFFGNSYDGNRWNMRYNAGELDPSAIICQGYCKYYNFQDRGNQNSGWYDPRVLYSTIDLRAEDPNNPGYPDMSPQGVLHPGGTHAIPPGEFEVYQGFNKSVDGLQTIFLSASEPLTTAPVGWNVCMLIDTNNPDGSSNDSAWWTVTELRGHDKTGDYYMTLQVFENRPLDLHIRARGSQLFPGDPGRPIVLARRANSGPIPETDDFISLDIVADNSTPSPITADVKIEYDKGTITGKTASWKDITRFFRPRIANPLTFPPGRTILSVDIPQALKDRVVAILPLNLRGRVSLTDPGTGSVMDTEAGTWGLRSHPGEIDARTDDAYFLTQTPSEVDNGVAVRFESRDLPSSSGYVLSGLSVTGIELGGAGQAGFDVIELHQEDPIFDLPDNSPNGTLRRFGVRDGVGDVPLGGPGNVPVELILDFNDIYVDPVLDHTVNYWVEVAFEAGDTINNGTMIMADNIASTRFPNSYETLDHVNYDRVTLYGAQHFNFEVRLLTDGSHGTLVGGDQSIVTGKMPVFGNVLVSPFPPMAFGIDEDIPPGR